MRCRSLPLLCLALVSLVAGCGDKRAPQTRPAALQGPAGPGSLRSGADAGALVTLRHPPTLFSIVAPSGFELSFSKGVYLLRRGDAAMSFSRSVTRVTPEQYGTALLKALGGQVLAREATAVDFAVQLDRGRRRDAFVVTRKGDRLEVMTGGSTAARPVPLAELRAVSASASGGVALQTPKAAPAAIPLREYTAPDGGSSALVPAEPGWTFDGGGGVVQGARADRGSFIYGASINVLLPEQAPADTPRNIVVNRFVDAREGLRQIIPKLYPAAGGIRIRRRLLRNPFPGFTSSGVFLFDYRVSGRPWTGVALIATDSPAKYSNFVWNFYHSAIGVPRGTDPSVGVGLLRSWRSWNPSRAIQERHSRMLQLLRETNDIWRQTSEYRSRAADRQSRDVGCLLLGYQIIEDNSRKYDLPPAPCGYTY